MGTIDLNDLGVFVTVVDVQSFSAAATRMRVPKSSVSRAIGRLEDAVGGRILHRTTRRLALSTVGKALYEKVRNDVASLRRSVGELPDLEEEPSGRVKITCALSCEAFLADVVARFVSRYPNVQVDLRLSNEYVDLVAEGIDLGLRFATTRLKDSSLNARKVCRNSMHLFAAPSYVARRGLPRSPRDLDRHDMVLYSRKTELLLEEEGTGAKANLVMRGRIVCDDLAFVRAAIINGCGIGYLSPYVAESDLAAGTVVRILPRWNCHISTLWAIWPGPRQLPRRVSAFLDILMEAVQGRAL
jgi:DNA-binding transcriptional LysR family regulator